MNRSRLRPILFAMAAWAGATALVVGGYAVWAIVKGVEFRWDLARDAALMALPIALVFAWRDRKG